MSNDNKLKARLLAGANRTEPLYVPEFETDACGGAVGDEVSEDCDGVIRIRPLTDAEQAEVDTAKAKGVTVRGTPGQKAREQEVDAAVTVEGERRGRRIAAAYGMSVDGVKWSPAEVGKLDSRAVKRIARRVEELSGAGEDQAEAVREFRGDAGSPDDGGTSPDGDPTGEDAG